MFLFLVTPCLVVALQPCMEWIPIKKKLFGTSHGKSPCDGIGETCYVMLLDSRNNKILYRWQGPNLDHWSKNVSFNKKDNEKNRVHKESRAEMERKTSNIGNFSQYLDNCSQLWFRTGLDDSNYLWKNSEALFSVVFKEKNL